EHEVKIRIPAVPGIGEQIQPYSLFVTAVIVIQVCQRIKSAGAAGIQRNRLLEKVFRLLILSRTVQHVAAIDVMDFLLRLFFNRREDRFYRLFCSAFNHQCLIISCHYPSYSRIFAYFKTRSIVAPPRHTSPSYSTTACPGVTARAGSSNMTSSLSSPILLTVTGTSPWRYLNFAVQLNESPVSLMKLMPYAITFVEYSGSF